MWLNLIKLALTLAIALAKVWERKQAENAARNAIKAEQDAVVNKVQTNVRDALAQPVLSDRLRDELIELGKRQAQTGGK